MTTFPRRPRQIAIVACAVLAALLLAGIALAQRPQADAVVARVTIGDPIALRRFLALGLDMLETRQGNDYFILSTAAQVQQLAASGWAARVDQEQTALLHPTRLDTFQGGYRTGAEMRAFLDAEAAHYPGLTEVFTYGRSYEGRDLFAIRLTNRQLTGTKPAFFLMAAIHARELATPELALRLADYLLSRYGTDGDASWLLDEHQLIIVPLANPDGHVLAEQSYYQRKNTDRIGGGNCATNPPLYYDQFGVDLNRNSTFKWGLVNGSGENPCGQTYPGPSATSEPETVALQDLIGSLFPVQRGPNDGDAAPLTTTGILLTLHSYGNLVLHPWGWTSAPAPNEGALALMAGKFASYNGYTSEPGATLYPTSGTTDDWSYGALGIPSFTFEVGPDNGACGGFFPDFGCLDGAAGGSFWPLNLPAFLYAARIARAPYQLVLGPSPEAITATALLGGQVSLNARFTTTYNGGQNIAAAEYYIDVPPWRGGGAHAMTALDGAFNSPSESATTVSAPLPAGRHLLFARAQSSGGWGPVRAAFVTVLAPVLWLPFVMR